jgi:replicative superfamily II helicase
MRRVKHVLLIILPLSQVESSQSVIRIVGLSATLPNYLDVADFLRFAEFLVKITGLICF